MLALWVIVTGLSKDEVTLNNNKKHTHNQGDTANHRR